MNPLEQLLSRAAAAAAFDGEAANAVARQLELSAQAHSEVLGMFQNDLPKVREGWTGPHRRRFDAAASRVLVNGQFWAQLLSELATVARARALEAEVSARAAAKLRTETSARHHLWPPAVPDIAGAPG